MLSSQLSPIYPQLCKRQRYQDCKSYSVCTPIIDYCRNPIKEDYGFASVGHQQAVKRHAYWYLPIVVLRACLPSSASTLPSTLPSARGRRRRRVIGNNFLDIRNIKSIRNP